MMYELAIKVIWPRAYQNDETGVWFIGTSGQFAPITFDALLAVWRERLEPEGWWWGRKMPGQRDSFYWQAVCNASNHAVYQDGTDNPLHDFTILTALALQAKEPTP